MAPIQAQHHLAAAAHEHRLRFARPIGSPCPAPQALPDDVPQPTAPIATTHLDKPSQLLVFSVGVLTGAALVCASLAIGLGRIPLPFVI